LAAGEIVDHLGYNATFLSLGAAALVALIVFAVGMPETAERETALPPLARSASSRYSIPNPSGRVAQR
jgi:predicted MFS family arabinose efflux permease